MKIRGVFLLIILGLTVAATLSSGEPSPLPGASPDSGTVSAVPTNAVLSRSTALIDQASRDRDASQKFLAQTRQLTLTILTEEQALLKRREEQADRYEKILATWEKQQAQYQKYLDSLPMK